jgi:hypothetical protein
MKCEERWMLLEGFRADWCLYPTEEEEIEAELDLAWV